MRLAAAALASLVTLAGAGPGWAQQPDPYAEAVKGEKLKRYYEFRAYYLKQTEYLAWANGCNVVHNPGLVSAMLNIVAAGADETIIDGHVADMHAEAYKRGLDKAHEVSGCQYWHDHPAEVLSLRRRALSAVR